MARIVRILSLNASNWNFASGYYWQYVNQNIIDQIVSEGIRQLTQQSTPEQGWSTLIPYTTGQTVGIQINGNDFWRGRGDDERMINTLPQVINAVIKGLKSIGIPETSISVIEPTHPQLGERIFWTYYYNIVQSLYPAVSMVYGTSAGYATSPTIIPELGNRHLSNLIAAVNHLIILPCLKAIAPPWGVTGTLKMMQGAIERPLDNHPNLASTLPSNPDIIVYGYIRSKVRLLLADGIFGTWTGQHFDGELGAIDIGVTTNDIPKPWLTFNNGAPNILFFGTDPVALDQILLNHLNVERAQQDLDPSKSLVQLPDPQIAAGETAGLGSRTNIDYFQMELGASPTQGTLTIESQPLSNKQIIVTKL